jgi:voltage-gated potassium channel Kch
MSRRESRYVRVARIAHGLAQEVLPRYAHPKSPHRFTCPQLAACVLLMIYLNKSYRDMEEWLLATDAVCLLLEGDATADATLLAAGIRRARGLIAASDSDAGNTFITLSAKALAPEVSVIVRAGTPANAPEPRQAGAGRVISPYTLVGQRIALSAAQPFVVDFVDTLVRGRHGGWSWPSWRSGRTRPSPESPRPTPAAAPPA